MGHTNDSRTVEEVLERVEGYQLENIIKEVFVWDKNAIGIPLEYLKVSKVNYPNNCRSLDLSKVPELNSTSYKQFFIVIRELGDYTIAVHFNGKSLDTGRNIRENNLRSTGDDIILKEENVSKAFMVEIAQREFVEEDPLNDCRDYPNADYATYDECDNKFMREKLPGLTPVWITEDPAEVTIQKDDENFTYWGLIDDLVDGSLVSDCPLPCKMTQTHTEFLDEYKSYETFLDISFSSRVRVTKTDLVKPTLSSFLSEVGGSIGLWLGLGVAQAFQLSVNCVLAINRKFKTTG